MLGKFASGHKVFFISIQNHVCPQDLGARQLPQGRRKEPSHQPCPLATTLWVGAVVRETARGSPALGFRRNQPSLSASCKHADFHHDSRNLLYSLFISGTKGLDAISFPTYVLLNTGPRRCSIKKCLRAQV